MTPEEKQLKWHQLFSKLVDLSSLYNKKSYRAKSQDKSDYWWNKYMMLSAFIWKSTRHNMRIPGEKFKARFGETNGYVFGYVRRSEAEAWWKRKEVDRREQGRQKFLNTCYYAPWFLSESLNADYGTYTCDQCGRTFHHSPSRITKAAVVVITCCCGYCTNSIIKADHGSIPFT